MFQLTLFGIFLLGASKSDFQEKILHYKVINYKITCLLNLEIYFTFVQTFNIKIN